MSTAGRGPRRILVLSGGLIHLVHQLAVLRELETRQAARGGDHPGHPAAGGSSLGAARLDGQPERSRGVAMDAAAVGAASPAGREGPAQIAVLITGVLTRNPAALAALQDRLEPWFERLRQDGDGDLAGLQLVREPRALPDGRWDLVYLNNQWQTNQRDWMERLAIPELVVCGDGLGLYYRCARELRALLPSLLGRPIQEPGRRVRYVLSGRQPCWHRPPRPAEAAPLAERRRLFALLVDSLRPQADAELRACLQVWEPDRPLWLCSVPNLAHQFPGERIAPAVLQRWLRHLERRHGFESGCDRLLLLDHPKAPADGSFGALQQPWLAGPLRSSLPLEVLIALLREARPEAPVRVCGMTSALYGVHRLNGVPVVWLPLGPLWRHNPNYRRKPLEFLHRGLRLARMALLTSQREPTGGG